MLKHLLWPRDWDWKVSQLTFDPIQDGPYFFLYIYFVIQTNVILLSLTPVVMMPIKLATPEILKIKGFWNGDYDFITSVFGIINKSFSRVSNYVVDLVIWPKFGKSYISYREVAMTKRLFLRGGQVLGMLLRFYNSLTKILKWKVRKFWGLAYSFGEIAGKNLPLHSE